MASTSICGVYELRAPNGNRYIGSGLNCEKRYRYHKADSMKGKHSNRRLMHAFIKYGDLKFSILLICRPEDRFFYEQLCIDNLKPEYNISTIAKGRSMTPEECKAKSDEMKAKFSDPIEAEKIRSYLHSPETRAKTTRKLIGRTLSSDHKANISSALSTPEAKFRQSKLSKIYFQDEEYRKRKSESAKQQPKDSNGKFVSKSK